jgi:hypothetical protein
MTVCDSPLSLVAHPDNPSSGELCTTAQVAWLGTDRLRFRYRLQGDLRSLRIPAPVMSGGRADGLWAHTCFEAFVALDGSPRYLELNFSPSGEWAAYGFDTYRQGMAPAAMDTAPRLALQRHDRQLELEAEVPLSGILASGQKSSLRIGLSAVVEDRQGRLSYWALRHPPGRPDFHHPHGFSLALEFPRTPRP